MKDYVGVGIIGCGNISRSHANAIEGLEHCHLVAVSSRNEEKARKMSEDYQCDYHLEYLEMIQRNDIDMVIVCTPNNTHASIGIEAAKAGKHIIVEKPIDSSVEAAQKLIDVSREMQVKLTCIFQHRYDGAIIALKEAVESGKLGKITSASCHGKFYRPQAYYDSSPGRGTWASDGGGAVIMNGIHYIDSLIHIAGPVEDVFAYTQTAAHEAIEVEDVATAVVKFRSGVIGTIEASTAAFPGKMARIEVNGTDGSVIIENDHIKDWRIKDAAMELQPFYGTIINDEDYRDNGLQYEVQSDLSTFQQQIGDFANAILKDEEPFITGESALHSFKVVMGIYESARTGLPVRID